MQDDLDAFKGAYRRLTRTGAVAPDDEELAELVTGELNDSQRAAVVERLLRSPEAAERYRTLQALHDAAQPSSRGRFVRWSTGVAAAVSFAAFVFVSAPESGTTDLVLRGSAQQASPAGNARLLEAPDAFRWRQLEDARRYRVTVYDASARPVWESSWTTDAEVSYPAQGLPTAGAYFWMVQVDGGGSASELGPYWFYLES